MALRIARGRRLTGRVADWQRAIRRLFEIAKLTGHPHSTCRSDVAVAWRIVEVPDRVHSFVQHAGNLDDTLLGDAIVKDMNRPLDLRSASRAARISDVEAPKT